MTSKEDETRMDAPLREEGASMSSETLSVPTVAKASDTEEGDDEDRTSSCHGNDDDFFFDLGLMFDRGQPTRCERFRWETPDGRILELVLDVIDGDPGALQSGLYIRPAAEMLSKYLIEHYFNLLHPSIQNLLPRPVVVLELGAGCGLCSCTAWQLWSSTLQCLMVTDRDSITLEQARCNHETTLENLLDKDCLTEEELDATINKFGSIPACFEILEWGNLQHIENAKNVIAEHSVPTQRHADYILGSDLIYDTSVVEPLLETVSSLLKGSTHGRFFLSQSSAFDNATEAKIAKCCADLGLSCNVLMESDDVNGRIQEFYFVE